MKRTKINMTSVYLQQYTIYNATKHHVYGIFQTLNLEYLILCKRTLNIPCNGNKPKQIYTLQITEVSNSAKRHADSSGNRQTVKPVTSKKIANFSRNLFTDQIVQTRSLLHSERLSKFCITRVSRLPCEMSLRFRQTDKMLT